MYAVISYRLVVLVISYRLVVRICIYFVGFVSNKVLPVPPYIEKDWKRVKKDRKLRVAKESKKVEKKNNIKKKKSPLESNPPYDAIENKRRTHKAKDTTQVFWVVKRNVFFFFLIT